MIRRGVKMVFLGIIMLAAFSSVIMLLWNWLIPSIFGLSTINIWQAIGLFILSRILFGGFGFGRHHRKRIYDKRANFIHDKWLKMTPEQREEFIKRRRQFGFDRHLGRNDFDCKEYGKSGKENE